MIVSHENCLADRVSDSHFDVKIEMTPSLDYEVNININILDKHWYCEVV